MSSHQGIEDLIDSVSGEAVSALVQDRCSHVLPLSLTLWLWLKPALRRAWGITEQVRIRFVVS